MDEAYAVLARLDRIAALEAAGAPASRLLAEVGALVCEADAWLRVEPEVARELAGPPLERCRVALYGELVAM